MQSSSSDTTSDDPCDVNMVDVIDPMRVKYHELGVRMDFMEDCVANVDMKIEMVLQRIELLTQLRARNLDRWQAALSATYVQDA